MCNNDKCELDGLESSTIHTIQVCMDTKNNGESKTICNYIDKTAPTFSSLNNPTNGDWTNKSFSLKGSASDSRSGIDYWYYQYGNSAWEIYSASKGKTNYTTTPFSLDRNENVKIWACDNVGNCSSKSTRIRIDTKDPKLAAWHKVTNLKCRTIQQLMEYAQK